MGLPLVRLTGSPFAQGTQHGAVLRERIAQNLEIYFDRFARETQLPRAQVLSIARQWTDATARQSPAYAEGMRGVAEGGGFDPLEIAALNARYEILYYQFGKLALEKAAAEGRADGCTAFVVLPEASADGHLWMGQNWDWIPEVRGAMLHATDEDGFSSLAFTEAGIVGAKIGLNDAGVGLAINGITTTEDDWSRLRRPFHVRAWEILRARSFERAVQVITDEPRSCSTNFVVGGAPDQAIDIEAAPDVHNPVVCEAGLLTHANHFVAPDRLGIVEPPNERRIYSKRRAARLRALLDVARPLTPEKIQDALRNTDDFPFGLSRHRNEAEPPEQHYITVTSIVMDLTDKVLFATEGPPDANPYSTYRLAK